MPRLHLKRTPAEEERNSRKKAKKSSRKHREERKRHSDYVAGKSDAPPKQPRRSRSRSPRRDSAYSGRYYNQSPSAGDPGPSTHARHKDYDGSDDEMTKERSEQELFEEKMRDALEDDGLYDPTQRLDGVEARLNSYAHIPRRWRGTDEGFTAGLWMEDAREDIGLEPWQMNDDEYAEYIRAGMWRKKNQAEYEERLRRKEERRTRKEREQRLREETRKLEREAQVEREKRAAAKAKRHLEETRKLYEERWIALLSRPVDDLPEDDSIPLSFEDIPWPVAPPKKGSAIRDTDEITKDAVSSFLLHSRGKETGAIAEDATLRPSAKDVLRATMLKFHPDKFEARVLARVREKDREVVKDAANMVVRILNDLLKDLRE